MALSEKERQELLSFNTGEPIIITPCDLADSSYKYNIVAFIRSIADPTPRYVKSVQMTITFPESYPADSPSVCLYKTQLFHPNFTVHGKWTDNSVRNDETLSDYLMRLIKTMQFKEINAETVADRNAMAFYHKNKDRGVFPTDKVNYNTKPRISIIRVNETTIS